MAETTIAWCDYTFNGWIGCEKVSPACRSCYASVDTYARVSASRGLPLWGPGSTRHVTSVANWRKPLAWDRKAASMTSDHKPRVFAHSLSDVAEDRRDLDEPRAWLSELIRRTPNLQWLLLTKRIEHMARLFARDVLERCWVGTTAEDQQRADERIPHLLQTPAAVRFVSVEPMLGPVTLPRYRPVIDAATHPRDLAMAGSSPLDWVICGGESGPKARPFDVVAAEALRDQCRDAGVAFFMKQFGARPFDSREPDREGEPHPDGPAFDLSCRLKLSHPKGEDPSEWSGTWPREFPAVRHA